MPGSIFASGCAPERRCWSTAERYRMPSAGVRPAMFIARWKSFAAAAKSASAI